MSDPPLPQSLQSSSPPPPQAHQRGGKLIRTVLGPALKLWLRSQVESIERLTVEITGRDRQILSGQIPVVSVAATAAVYQGLHLGELVLDGQNIRINLGQVMRGKPLKLLEPIWITVQLQLSEADLNASLRSPLLEPLLAPGLKTIAAWLAPEANIPTGSLAGSLENLQLGLGEATLQLRADWVSAGTRSPVVLGAQVQLETDHLSLTQLQWLSAPPAGLRKELSDCPLTSIQLGEDVQLESFAIASGQIQCSGQITVNP